MYVIVQPLDQIAARYGKALDALGAKDAKIVLVRALNHEGDKGRTKVKRALVKQTGIKYGLINSQVTTKRAQRTADGLKYAIVARGTETNLNLFGARQGKRGVSAAPWGKRRVFKGTFIVPAYGGRVLHRTSKARGPLAALYGPNIGREIVKDQSKSEFDTILPALIERVGVQIKHLLSTR